MVHKVLANKRKKDNKFDNSALSKKNSVNFKK